MRHVTVQFHKFPDRLHWRHDTVYLGEDEHGVWVGSPAGSVIQRGHEPPINHPYRFVSVIDANAWYVPIFSPDDPHYKIYVDISTPPRWASASKVEMFDLDLDVILDLSGDVEVLDRDEFDQHCAEYDYPDDLIIGAEAATAFVVQAIESGHGPFGGMADHWLQMLDRST